MTLECIGTAIHFLSHGDGDGVGVEDCGFYKFCFYGHRQEKMQHPSLCVNIVPQYHSTTVPQYEDTITGILVVFLCASMYTQYRL